MRKEINQGRKVRSRSEINNICLKQRRGSGLKESAANLYPNFPSLQLSATPTPSEESQMTPGSYFKLSIIPTNNTSERQEISRDTYCIIICESSLCPTDCDYNYSAPKEYSKDIYMMDFKIGKFMPFKRF